MAYSTVVASGFILLGFSMATLTGLYSFVFFVSAKLSYKLRLVDIPNERKIHSKPTAFTGGITISIILLFALQAIDVFDKSYSPNLFFE